MRMNCAYKRSTHSFSLFYKMLIASFLHYKHTLFPKKAPRGDRLLKRRSSMGAKNRVVHTRDLVMVDLVTVDLVTRRVNVPRYSRIYSSPT